MSTATARSRTARARRSSRARPAVRRRRRAAVAVTALLAAGTGALVFTDAVREITLPLRHDDIIRQQAREKGLDPALIAAVIYEESRFRDQTSHAGARGLMQITPETARFIARDSGGTKFVEGDLGSPQINIAYGAYYLRYLLNRYDGDVPMAIAAYNAGETRVSEWVAASGGELDVADIPFPETRAYVENVIERRGEYADNYADDLGL